MSDNEKEVIYVVESKNTPNDSLKTYNMITYALYGVGIFTGGVLWIIALIMNYVKAGDAAGTMYESHIKWQIRTFWWGLVWLVLGMICIATFIGSVIGFPLLLGNSIWVIYRVVKGFIRLNDNKPAY